MTHDPQQEPADADAPLDVFDLVERLLPDVQLTPSQLAGVRAMNTKLQTELADMDRRARAEGRAWSAPSPAERAALRAMLVEDLRSLLEPGQRRVLERRLGRPG